MSDEKQPATKVNPFVPPEEDDSKAPEPTEAAFEAVSEPATAKVRKVTRFDGVNKYEVEG